MLAASFCNADKAQFIHVKVQQCCLEVFAICTCVLGLYWYALIKTLFCALILLLFALALYDAHFSCVNCTLVVLVWTVIAQCLQAKVVYTKVYLHLGWDLKNFGLVC